MSIRKLFIGFLCLPLFGLGIERDSTLLLSIDGVVNETLNVLTGPSGQDRDWDWFKKLFTEDARIVLTVDHPNKPRQHASMDLDRFIQQAGPVYKMRGFKEYELKKKVMEYNGIATVFQSYAAIQGQDTTFGINTYHLIRIGEEWKISQILFANNSNGNDLGNEWLPNPGYQEEIKSFQGKLDALYADPVDGPLGKEEASRFNGHPFYPIRESNKVWAKLDVTPNSEWFEMPTSTGEKLVYRQYGIAHFKLDGMNFQLRVYQSQKRMNKPGEEDNLFLPFSDYTNGFSTFGGGRYIDVQMDKDYPNRLLIDFNKAYNPYCGYNENFSCPLVPNENRINYPILAGMKYHDSF